MEELDPRQRRPSAEAPATVGSPADWGASAKVFTFGDAGFYGSLAGTRLDQPVVAITPTPDGGGYWLAGADGGVFTLGDARYAGSAATLHHRPPVAGILVTGTLTDSTPTGPDARYHLIGADGTDIAPPGNPPGTS